MSLITACPACQTQFEVTDEQLLAYAGKVRCGECNHVFDARSSLVEEATPVVVPAPDPIEVIPAEEAPVEKDLADVPVASSVTLDSTTEYWESNGEASVFEAEEPEPTPSLSWNIQPEETHEAGIPEFLRNVSFSDDRPLQPEKTSRQWIFAVLSSVLIATLLLQLVYFSRTSLAANYPQAKPLLLSACKVAHCVVALPSDIAQLTIDDADIQEHREHEGVLVFSSVLINHGSVAQAYPNIELTLTNMADEPVLRKILKPSDYLPTSSKTTEGLAAQQELPVKTSLGVEEKAVTGFRVAIAY